MEQLFICSTGGIFRLMPTFHQPILAGFIRVKQSAKIKTQKIIKSIDTAKYSKSKIKLKNLINELYNFESRKLKLRLYNFESRHTPSIQPALNLHDD